MTQTPPQPLRVVAVSGTLSSPSKTDALVDAVLDELALVLPIERHVIRVSELGPLFAGALTRDQLDERVERELRAVEGADLLIAASPVYRASFTGLFKHFFDFVEQYALVDAVLDELALVLPIERHVIRVSELGPLFAGALTRDQLDERVERELRAVEGADLLIAASPVYRASFTGLFKHFFDFVEQYALVDVPVLLAATGGSERHALILEHSLRPLFGFFQALTLPLGVYAHASDFTDRRVTAPLLQERIRAAIARGLPLVRSSVDEKRRIERAVSGVGDELDALPTPTAQDAAPVRLYS